MTSMNWPKPKIKLDSKQGSVRGAVAAGAGWAKDEEGELGGVGRVGQEHDGHVVACSC